MSLGSYFYGDRIVLASTRAKEVSKEDAPRLHNLVEGLAIAAGTPTPKVWIVPESAPNAFATGRDPEHSHVAVTQGLLDTMNRVELEGVIGHEMAHVLDRDILVGTVVATLVGAGGAPGRVLHADVVVGWVPRQAGERLGGGAASAIIFAGVPPPDPGADLRAARSGWRCPATASSWPTHKGRCSRYPPGRSPRSRSSSRRPPRCAPRTTRPRTSG